MLCFICRERVVKRLESLFRDWLKEMCIEMVRIYLAFFLKRISKSEKQRELHRVDFDR